MKYTRIKVIDMMLFFSVVSMLVFSCTNNTQTIKVLEDSKIIVSVLDASIQNGNIEITLEINNKDSIDYYMMYSYKGDLDKRDFPSIENKENDLYVEFKPFYSEKVSKYFAEHEDDNPVIATGDEIGLQNIPAKDKRNIILNFPYTTSKIDDIYLSIYFGKYLEQKYLSDDETIYISPTKEFYDLFSFEKISVKIR